MAEKHTGFEVTGPIIDPIETLTVDSTTPSVIGGNLFKTANINPTNITDFAGAVNGQKITIIIGDANTDFTHNAGILWLLGAANWTTSVAGDTISFISDGTVWYEVSRSVNT